jgi:hypothetical protein
VLLCGDGGGSQLARCLRINVYLRFPGSSSLSRKDLREGKEFPASI